MSRVSLIRTTSDQLPFSWKSVGKRWGHPIHQMMPRVGSFPPALARYFIQAYSNPGELIFDPFCGKGTVVVEALLTGRRVLATDIAPDAIAVTKAKSAGTTASSLERYLAHIAATTVPDVSLLSSCPPEVRVFFHDQTLAELVAVRDVLLAASPTSRRAQALLGCLLGILHGHAQESLSVPSAHAYAMAPAYVERYKSTHGLATPRRSVVESLQTKIKKCLPADMQIPKGDARIYRCSATRYSFRGSTSLTNSVALILTSPPYFNTQTYAKDAWLRLWLLGYDYRTLLGEYISTGSIATYSASMKTCLGEMLRVLRPGGRALLVAGDVTLHRNGRRERTNTAQVLADIALNVTSDEHRWEVEAIVTDEITSHSRYLFPVHKNGSTPALEPKTERILYLRKVPAKSTPATARPHPPVIY